MLSRTVLLAGKIARVGEGDGGWFVGTCAISWGGGRWGYGSLDGLLGHGESGFHIVSIEEDTENHDSSIRISSAPHIPRATTYHIPKILSCLEKHSNFVQKDLLLSSSE